MRHGFFRLLLGLGLIFAASAILLMADASRLRGTANRAPAEGGRPGKIHKVALFQHVSQPTLEEGIRGVIAGLAASGFRAGETIQLKRYNAEADSATSLAIAKEIAGSDFDLVITITTPSLQAMAAANRDVKMPHVFGLVSDPVAAGVGISADDPLKHPPAMVGLGTMQPVADAFRMARGLAPGLARVGVAWNPSEANSEACTKVARKACRELGIELIEANVDNAAGVREAIASLISRGVEAIWIGGDVTVLTSLDSVVGPTRTAQIPVFSNIPGSTERGVLFDLGADYYQVGGTVGQLASRVLLGESPAKLPMQYVVPPQFCVNEVVLKTFQAGWSLPEEVASKVDVLITAGGPVRRHPPKEPASVVPTPSLADRQWRIGLVSYLENVVMEQATAGFEEALLELGLVEGRNLTLRKRSAQGDVATLNAICDEFNGDDTELVVSLSTPALQAATRKLTSKPLLFGVVLDPITAGAGTSNTDHRSNVTGVYLDFPYAVVVRTIRELAPNAQRVGTLFTPGELNSTIARQRLEAALKAEGMKLVSTPVNSASEVSEAAQNLIQSNIDLFCQISDSLSNTSFPAISRVCEAAKLPLFAFTPEQVKQGAVVAVGSDYRDHGRELGKMVAEVLGGKDPAQLPFRSYGKPRRAVNLETARRLGFAIPGSWVQQADLVIPEASTTSR